MITVPNTFRRLAWALAIGLTLTALAPRPSAANDAQKLIDDAAAMVRSIADRSEWAEFQEAFAKARGVVLVPDFMEAGFFLGGAGGQCLVLARSGPEHEWSSPSFCMIGEASFGLQIGFQKSEMIMLVMNDGALLEILTGTAKLGGDAGLAVGMIGAGVKGATTLNLDVDILAFSRNQGLYGGIVIDGGWIGPDTEYNHAFYGRAVTARHIVMDRRVSSPTSGPLIAALDKAG